MSIVYFNKQFVPLFEANLSIRTNALHYGSSVFEGIRAYWNPNEQQLFVFRLPEHYGRMLNSCKVLKLKVGHDLKELCALTVDLLRRNQPKEDSYIRPIAFVRSEGLTPKLIGYDTGFAIYTLSLGDYIDASGGLKVGFLLLATHQRQQHPRPLQGERGIREFRAGQDRGPGTGLRRGSPPDPGRLPLRGIGGEHLPHPRRRPGDAGPSRRTSWRALRETR